MARSVLADWCPVTADWAYLSCRDSDSNCCCDASAHCSCCSHRVLNHTCRYRCGPFGFDWNRHHYCHGHCHRVVNNASYCRFRHCRQNCCADWNFCCPVTLALRLKRIPNSPLRCDLRRTTIAPLLDPRMSRNWMHGTASVWRHRSLHRISKNILWDLRLLYLRCIDRQTLCKVNAEWFLPVNSKEKNIRKWVHTSLHTNESNYLRTGYFDIAPASIDEVSRW